MEWAYELVNGYKRGNARVRRLVGDVRTIVVPIVNPDGFNISRVAGTAATNQGGRGGPNPGEDNETVNIVSHPYEYRRKNCRVPGERGGGQLRPAGRSGLAALGVDPNRNYGTFWGGPGASPRRHRRGPLRPRPVLGARDQEHQSTSSPARQVTMLITNHTFSDLILRPPGLASQGNPPDEGQLKALGDSMAHENGYFSQHGFDLYDTTGTTEDWSYNSTGGFGYTFEIGCVVPDVPNQDCVSAHFHPPYQKVLEEYEGTSEMSRRFKARTAAATARRTSRPWRRPPTRASTRCSRARGRTGCCCGWPSSSGRPTSRARRQRQAPSPSRTSSRRSTRSRAPTTSRST